ncbi:MAG TPA: hypothetical protein VFP54_10765 [Acidimicrobiales bacterium]|nr:hypothetical protein [Acidimicrobiales bacterium]
MTTSGTGSRAAGRFGWRVWAAIATGFTALSVALWAHAWAAVGSRVPCPCGDPGQAVWYLQVVARSLAAGHLPAHSDMAWWPGGVNLLANNSITALGTVLAPLTLTVGPVTALVVALTAAPAASATAGAWAASRFGVRPLPAALAGLVYGFSPMAVQHLAFAHLNLTFLPGPALLAGVAHEVVAGRGRPGRWGAFGGMVAAAQFFVSTEILADTAVLVAVTVLAGAAVAPRRLWERRRRVATGLGAAGGVAAVLLAGPAWYALAGPGHLSGTIYQNMLSAERVDALRVVWAPSVGTPFPLGPLAGYSGLQGPPVVYLGPVGAAAVVVAAWALRRRAAARVAVGVLAAAVVLALGDTVTVRPSRSSALLPGGWLHHLPVLDNVIPARLAFGEWLAAGLLAALALDAAWDRLEGSGAVSRAAAALVAMAVVVSVAVTYRVPLAEAAAGPSAWFDAAAQAVPAGSSLLAYPVATPGNGGRRVMFDAAVADRLVPLTAGYSFRPGVGHRAVLDAVSVPEAGLRDLLTLPASFRAPSATDAAAYREELARWRVGVVAVAPGDPVEAAWITTVLGPGVRAGGGWWWSAGAVRPRR